MSPSSNPVTLAWNRIHTLIFAGGGNRCWWQGGLMDALMARGFNLPPRLLGTSAGAAVAAACLGAGPTVAMQACRSLYAANEQMWMGRGLQKLRLQFAHQHIYPAWLQSFLDASHFEAICRSGSELRVAVTHPARWLGLRGSVVAASLAYLLDKKMLHSIHPRLPRWLGLRQGFYSLNQCTSAEAARTLLMGAAAAPPLMKAQALSQAWALDGGYVDNAPLPESSEPEASRSGTLVLLTRHYPHLPSLFQWRKRLYWQPSAPVPVSTWDCRRATVEGVTAAFELGRSDAQSVIAGRQIHGLS